MAQFKGTKNKLQKIRLQETKNTNEIDNLQKINVIMNPEQFLKKIVRIKLFKKYNLKDELGTPLSTKVTMIDGGGEVG